MSGDTLAVMVSAVAAAIAAVASIIGNRKQNKAAEDRKVVKAELHEAKDKVEKIEKSVNGELDLMRLQMEFKRKENRMLYRENQLLREQLIRAGIKPDDSDLRMGPLEGETKR